MLKRALDICASAVGLLLLSPLLLALAAMIKWTSAGPVFYRGSRVGLSRQAVSHLQVPVDGAKRRARSADPPPATKTPASRQSAGSCGRSSSTSCRN